VGAVAATTLRARPGDGSHRRAGVRDLLRVGESRGGTATRPHRPDGARDGRSPGRVGRRGSGVGGRGPRGRTAGARGRVCRPDVHRAPDGGAPEDRESEAPAGRGRDPRTRRGSTHRQRGGGRLGGAGGCDRESLVDPPDSTAAADAGRRGAQRAVVSGGATVRRVAGGVRRSLGGTRRRGSRRVGAVRVVVPVVGRLRPRRQPVRHRRHDQRDAGTATRGRARPLRRGAVGAGGRGQRRRRADRTHRGVRIGS